MKNEDQLPTPIKYEQKLSHLSACEIPSSLDAEKTQSSMLTDVNKSKAIDFIPKVCAHVSFENKNDILENRDSTVEQNSAYVLVAAFFVRMSIKSGISEAETEIADNTIDAIGNRGGKAKILCSLRRAFGLPARTDPKRQKQNIRVNLRKRGSLKAWLCKRKKDS